MNGQEVFLTPNRPQSGVPGQGGQVATRVALRHSVGRRPHCGWTFTTCIDMYSNIIREPTQKGHERQQKRYKILDLTTEYNEFTWECNQLAIFP